MAVNCPGCGAPSSWPDPRPLALFCGACGGVYLRSNNGVMRQATAQDEAKFPPALALVVAEGRRRVKATRWAM